MEKFVEQGILYDFYGELLTEHQKKIYEDVVINNYSLAEIAEEYEISRQGVHDLMKRCDNLLISYENKLHLAQRFLEIKNQLNILRNRAQDPDITKDELAYELMKYTEEILKEL